MTLAVGLIVPDGVVIAADSLATTQGRLEGIAEGVINTKCPKCNEKFEIKDFKVPLPTIPMAISTRSFSQKVFTFGKRIGIASYGIGFLEKKTIYNHIKSLEKEENLEEEYDSRKCLEILGKYFEKLFLNHFEAKKVQQDNFLSLGFLLGFFEKDQPKVVKVEFGKFGERNLRQVEHDKVSCTVAGDYQLVTSIWEYSRRTGRKVTYDVFSLQDAIDHVEFLINFTSQYQRFLAMIPTVGGEVDILLMTQYKPPIWIKSKALNRLLQEGEIKTEGEKNVKN
jgi:hypothetical protein